MISGSGRPGPARSRDHREIRPYGEDGLLVEVPEPDGVLGLYAALAAASIDGVEEVIPAACTVLLRLRPGADSDRVAREVGSLPSLDPDRQPGELVEIPVTYDGPDLDDVAVLTKLSVEQIVALHTGRELTVAFCGFAPGFAYLSGLPKDLQVSRRDEPRTRVPAGSVGLAGDRTGVYPRESPGGWQLIGRTDVVLWDLERDPPALLRPGLRVRFTVA